MGVICFPCVGIKYLENFSLFEIDSKSRLLGGSTEDLSKTTDGTKTLPCSVFGDCPNKLHQDSSLSRDVEAIDACHLLSVLRESSLDGPSLAEA
jgi:hypothetical protein